MEVTGIHAVAAVLIVVAGTVGAASVANLGGGASVTVEGADAVRSDAGNAAFEVRTTINNTDTANATRSYDLVVEDGSGSAVTVDERTVTLPPGETRRITLSVSRDALAPGRYNYTVADDSGALASGNVTLDPPAFTLSDARANEVVRGDLGTVTATVRNRGDFRGLRNVDLLLDRDRDGAFEAGETVATRAPTLRAGANTTVRFSVGTDGLDPGTYAYRVETADGAREGKIVVLRPAAVRVAGSAMTTDAVRGDRFNGSVTLTNAGDVTGTEMVWLDGPAESFDWNRSVTLDGNETRTFEFAASTANLTRGNYSVAVATPEDAATATLRVREGLFEVDWVGAPDSADVDGDTEFTARVTNVGDAAANETVEHRIDLDGDDDPETVTANRTVALASGERTTVEFVIPAEDRDRFTDDDLLGTHVYGVYTGDANVTNVVVVEDYYSGGGGSSSSSPSDGGDDETDDETVSKDAITQEKYGLDYDEVSGETQSQVDEIHERQPFADGLVITEVLTREEIARQEFGLDVERNDDFNFTAIDVETQQEIEAVFDDQFESDDGDRIESWDELARAEFDSEYEALDEKQKETIRERYRAQFDS